MKWIPLIAFAASSCFAGTLRGVVTNEGGLQIASAEVTIFNELAPLLIQVGKTDANGSYHFKLGAGIYRIIIVKKDYAPVTARISMDGEKITKNLQHKLLELKNLDENQYAKILKSIYRQSNRDPYRATEQGFESPLTQSQETLPTLTARVTSESRAAWNGETQRMQSIHMGAQLSESITLETELGQAHSANSHIRANFLDADVQFKNRWATTRVQAETIQNVESSLPGASSGIGISSHYGQIVRSQSGLRFRQAERSQVESQEMAVSQSADYRLGFVPIDQHLTLTAWEHHQEEAGRKAHLTTAATWGPTGQWQTGLDYQNLHLPDNQMNQGHFWVERHFANDSKSYYSQHRLGWLSDEQGSRLQQIHQFKTRTNALQIAGVYQENQDIEALSTFDLFGNFLEEPAMRFSLESLLKKQTNLWQFTLNLPHTSRLESQLSWTNRKDHASVLSKPFRTDLKSQAAYQSYEVAYHLQVEDWGSQFAISHRQHETVDREFDQLTLKFSQWLRPFRDKNRGLRFALQMGNQPNVPGWWLLEELPWDPAKSENWYEGQLQLQF